MTAIARDFKRLNLSDLTQLPFKVVLDLFDSDEINGTEDQVFDFIRQYCNALGEQLPRDSHEKLWTTCRFSQLSAPKVAECIDLDAVPAFWFKLGVACSFCASQGARALDDFILKRAAVDKIQARRLTRRKGSCRFARLIDDLGAGTVSGCIGLAIPEQRFQGNKTCNILTIEKGVLALTIEIGSRGDHDQYFGLLCLPEVPRNGSRQADYSRLKESKSGFCVAENDAPYCKHIKQGTATWNIKGKRVTIAVSVEERKARIWMGGRMVEQDDLPIETGVTVAVGLYDNSATLVGWRYEA